MHKSSSLTFLYKYILPIGALIGFVYTAWILFNEHGIKWYIGTLLILSWAGTFNYQHSTMLKTVKIDASGIHLNNGLSIGFDKLVWVKFITISPTYIYIKYEVENSMKKILIIPEVSVGNSLSIGKPEMYDFIRKNALDSNSGHFQANMTSAFSQIAAIMISGLVIFFIVVFYFYEFMRNDLF